MYQLIWLADVLRAANLKVVEQPNWQTRGHGDVSIIKGVICHHTAGGKTGNAPSLNIVQNGRPDLSGPLAHLVLGRDGTFYIVAAGLCYHAGAGNWNGITNGNGNMIGIEAENTGLLDDPWPEVQKTAYAKGVAAILKKIGAKVNMCCGHKEYALPKGRKPDPSFDMNAFRLQVGKLMGDIPVIVPKSTISSINYIEMTEANIKQLQTDLNKLPTTNPKLNVDGDFGSQTFTVVRKMVDKILQF